MHSQCVFNMKEPHVCPAILAPLLDNNIRRWLNNPEHILKGLIKEGQTVADIGCGPGVFTIAMARMVGSKGKVIAVDIQDKMIHIVRKKAEKNNLASRIQLLKCNPTSLCITTEVDFALLFYMLHEVLDKESFISQLASILKKGGTCLLSEPKLHVSESVFEDELRIANKNCLLIKEWKNVFFSRTVLFEKN